MLVPRPRTQGAPVIAITGRLKTRTRGAEASLATPTKKLWRLSRQSWPRRGPAAQTYFAKPSWDRSRDVLYDPATMWQAYVRFSSGSTTRADVAENEEDAHKALEDAMNQLKSNGIATVGPSLVVTKDDLEFIKLEQKQQDR
jgi:hypothetical protein